MNCRIVGAIYQVEHNFAQAQRFLVSFQLKKIKR